MNIQLKPIPSYRAAHLLPYLEFLRKIGAPVERGLRKAKLPTMLSDRCEIYLPQLPTLAFLKEMSSKEGIDELPLRALRHLGMTDLSEPFLAAALRSPNLTATLECFKKFAYVEDPDVQFWITSRGPSYKLCMLHRVPLDPQGTRYEDWNEILVLIAIVRAFAGAAWYPEEIASRSNVAFGRFALEQFPNTRFRIGQEAVWITVPRNLLSLPLRLKSYAVVSRLVSGSGQAPDAEPAQDFPGSLKRLLASYLVQGQPSVKVAAALASTSVRTLQRMLQECDTNYSDVLQQARFEVSTRLLRDKDIKIIDIAYEVGYEDPAHFTRAFKRLTGVGPHEYRCQLCLH